MRLFGMTTVIGFKCYSFFKKVCRPTTVLGFSAVYYKKKIQKLLSRSK